MESGETGILLIPTIQKVSEAIVHALEEGKNGALSRKDRNMFSVESMIQTTEGLYQGILDSK